MGAMDVGALLLIVALASPVAPAAFPVLAPAATAPAAAPATPSPSAAWTVGVAYQRDRFDYRFENPSSFNTAEPVPHFYEQTYDADNLWITGRVQFQLGSHPLETEGGFAPATTGVGSDYDTFSNPDGNVIVYGTTAVTDASAWRAAQYVGLGDWRGTRLRVGYSYRRDRAEFRPSDSTTVQTRPPSSTSVWNTDRETTISEVHEIRFGVDRRFASDPNWDVRLTADASPVSLARLTTELPDKYPDPIVSIAKGFSIDAALHVSRRIGRWSVGATVDYAQSWSYQDANQYHRRAVWAGGFVGR
jgi:hypothetical protein